MTPSWRQTMLWCLAATLACRSASRENCNRNDVVAAPSDQQARLPDSQYLIGSEGTGSIVGLLADSTSGLAIPGASVGAGTDTTHYAPHVTQTDTAGGFLLRDLPPGEYFLSASRPGYARSQAKILIRPGNVDTVRFTTARSRNLFLCTTVITS